MATERGRWQWKLAALVAVGLFALFAWTSRDRHAPIDVGSRAPDYAAATLDGDSLRLKDLRGDVVLVNIWATWCPPCIREMPALQRLHEALGSAGLRVLGVNVDNAAFGGDPLEMVHSFVNEMDLTFDILLDPENNIESAFQVPGLPMTFVIDRRGRIREKTLGPREWDSAAVQARMRTLLEN